MFKVSNVFVHHGPEHEPIDRFISAKFLCLSHIQDLDFPLLYVMVMF